LIDVDLQNNQMQCWQKL